MERLAPRHDRQGFACGDAALDDYLTLHAGQEMRRRVARVYVLCEQGSPIVLGYFTLSAFTVGTADLPREDARRLPRYPRLPALLIGRLAVRSDSQGQGLGRVLLSEALERCLSISEEVGALFVVVEALEDAAEFYRRRGFRELGAKGRQMYLPMATVARMVADG